MKPLLSGNSKLLFHPKYRADIDGLRAVAVLSIVGFHVFPEVMQGGFVGVDIFFVISGFLISTIIFESLELNSFSLVQFYTRRIKRIFPSLLIVLMASFIFGWLVLFPDEYKQLGKHITAGAGFFSNFTLWRESGYFDNAADTKPLLHLWSLGVEEQFYIIWPLLLVFAWKIRLNLLWVIFIIGMGSFLLNVTSINKNIVSVFYLPQTRFWELLLGAYLAYLKIKNKNNLSQEKTIKSAVLSWAGALLIVSSVFLMNKQRLFPGWWALFPTIGTALIILADSQTWLNRRILSHRVLVWFGLISFPLYLWHWPLLSFMRIIEGTTPSQLMRILVIFIAILLAWLTYQWIEIPIRASIRNKTLAVSLIFCMICTGVIGFSSNKSNGYQYRLSYIKGIMPQAASEQIGVWKYMTNENCLKKYPFDISGYRNRHWFCLKTTENDPTIMLLGSSYMNQNYPGFSKNKKLKNHTILSIGTCVVGLYSGFGNPGDPCYGDNVEKQRIFLDNIIATTKSLKYVIMDALVSVDPVYIKSISDRIKFIESFGIKVVVFTPHLKPKFHIKSCYRKIFGKKIKDCHFSFDEKEKQIQDFKLVMDFISKENPNTLFFDQNILHSEENNYAYVRDGVPLYHNATHLSEYGSIKLSDLFVRWAEKNLPSILEYRKE